MAKGATVYRNVGRDGKTDICFKYQNRMYEIDVKAASFSLQENCWYSTGASQVKFPVYPLLVVPEGGTNITTWYCRWIKRGNKYGEPVCPPGLENFWD